MGYHKAEIPKGELGDFSKVEEEWAELKDAKDQDNPILELCELADLLGAIGLYTEEKYNITLEGIVAMANATRTAFEMGDRT